MLLFQNSIFREIEFYMELTFLILKFYVFCAMVEVADLAFQLNKST